MAVAALVISIVAVVFAGVAAVAAVWSAVIARRSARTAAEAVELERVRYHDDRTPRLRLLYEPAQPGGDDGLWVINDGPGAYQVRVTLISREGGGPLEAVQVVKVGGGMAVVREGEEAELGWLLGIGDKYFLRLLRVRSLRRGVVRLRFTCSNEHGEWVTAAECEIPRRVPRVQVRRSNGATKRS
jgi:hypothetical protein